MSRVNLTKGKTAPTASGGYEKTSALVGYFDELSGTGANPPTITHGTPVEFRTPSEIEAYGITPESSPLLHRHISEYFRLAGRGASLFVLSVKKETGDTFAKLIAKPEVKEMIAAAGGRIFQIGFSYIPAATPTYVDGLHSELQPAIVAAQGFADWCRETNRTLHVVLEGAMYNASAAALALNLRDIKAEGVRVDCPNVSLVIGQDFEFADQLSGNNQKYADVGLLLGCMAAQPVSYNIGEVATMVLTDTTRNRYVVSGLSNHKKVVAQEADLATLNAKGYIFGEYYSGLVCFNDDHTCVMPIVDDEGNMNENTIALSRTNAKVFRELFRVYEQKLKMTVPVEPSTGLLGVGMIKYFEGLGNNIFDDMQAARELSGGKTVVDPQSKLLSGDKTLRVAYNWVPMGVVGNINGVINIKNKI